MNQFTAAEADQEHRQQQTHYPGDLYDYISQSKCRIPEATIRRMFREIAHNVARLHALGIAHRDLSLETVCLDANLQCHVQPSACEGVMGKLFYMAPEVQLTTPYDCFAADTWSLGIILYILLTGNPPFQHASDFDPGFRLFETRGFRVFVSSSDSPERDFPTDAVDLLEKMLASSPKQRPTIKEILTHPFVVSTTDAAAGRRATQHTSWVLLHPTQCCSCPTRIQRLHRKHQCLSCHQLTCSSCVEKHSC